MKKFLQQIVPWFYRVILRRGEEETLFLDETSSAYKTVKIDWETKITPEKKNTKKTLLENKRILEKVKETLKKEFIGLDDIIDEVLSLIAPWFIFPEYQTKPVIVNLWGMTGTGKTALVRRMMELLDKKNDFLHFDMGDRGENKGTSLKNDIIRHFSKVRPKNPVLCFDEFQFGSTLNKKGEEKPSTAVRVIWDLLDSGKFNYMPDSNDYLISKTRKFVNLLKRCAAKGVEVSEGIISDMDTFSSIVGSASPGYAWGSREKADDYFQSDEFIEALVDALPERYESNTHAKQEIMGCSLLDIINILRKSFENRSAMEEIDFSQALIFNLGNLDEAFHSSANMNPDISADDFYADAKEVSLPHIKEALKKRFRLEQIARLGNNHIIYPTFTEAGYKKLIEMELEKVSSFAKNHFGVELSFSDEVKNLLYAEGVIPTQGARPTLTTVKNYIDSYVGAIMCEKVENSPESHRIEWDFNKDKKRYEVFFFIKGGPGEEGEESNHGKFFPVRLKMEELRKNDPDDAQALVAVHEAGHAVAACLIYRIVPKMVVSRTASARSEGFCQTEIPKDVPTQKFLLEKIAVALAGRAAERIVFGDADVTTGASHDIQVATQIAVDMVSEYGMCGEMPVYTAREPSATMALARDENFNKKVQDIIKEQQSRVLDVLSKNKRFLLELAAVLMQKTRVNKEEIQQIAEKYSPEIRKKEFTFTTADKKFGFKRKLEMERECEINFINVDKKFRTKRLIKG